MIKIYLTWLILLFVVLLIGCNQQQSFPAPDEVVTLRVGEEHEIGSYFGESFFCTVDDIEYDCSSIHKNYMWLTITTGAGTNNFDVNASQLIDLWVTESGKRVWMKVRAVDWQAGTVQASFSYNYIK